MMRARLLFAGAVLLSSVAVSPRALAYCQTTSCLPSVSCAEDPENCCILDRNGCDENGIVVTWQSACTAYAIHEAGSTLRDITAQDLSDAVDKAFADWMAADCGAGLTPSIRFENFGFSQCDKVEVNDIAGGPNASIWMFRDEEWPHSAVDEDPGEVSSSALALTTVTFNYKTGELLDADVELNSAQGIFTQGDEYVYIDLQAIVAHEAGHFLGLDHTNDTTATMAPGYVPHTVDQRTLALDDEMGICASYQEDRVTTSNSCDPRGTYSAQCGGGGCSVAAGPGGAEGAANWLMALGAALLLALGVRRRPQELPVRVRTERRR